MQILHWYSMQKYNSCCWGYIILRWILITIPLSDKGSITTCIVKYNKGVYVQRGNGGTGYRIKHTGQFLCLATCK